MDGVTWPEGFAKGIRSFEDDTREIVAGRSYLAETFILSTPIPELSRLFAWRSLMRASLYLSERNLPYCSPAWKIIRGLAPLSSIGDVYRQPLCCATSGLDRKLIASTMALSGKKLEEAEQRAQKVLYKVWQAIRGILKIGC